MYKKYFAPFTETYLNVASEGPLPDCAKEALLEALEWKQKPYQLSIPKFAQVPLTCKMAIGELLSVAHREIILGNSATYGLQTIVNGHPFKAGDEIIVMRNDFPTDILPWLTLESQGVIVHQLKGKDAVLSCEDILAALTSRTVLVCLPLIHTFSGSRLEIAKIGSLLKSRNIKFVVNISQAAGAIPIKVSELQCDAVVCAGYKWLLGPYGTGFAWIDAQWAEQFSTPAVYWTQLSEQALSSTDELQLPPAIGVRRFDQFGTANFFNFYPWEASIRLLLSIGLDKVAKYNQTLTDLFLSQLDRSKFTVISPEDQRQSLLTVFSLNDAARNAELNVHLQKNTIHLALWKNNLRMSTHIFNDEHDIHHLLNCLNSFI